MSNNAILTIKGGIILANLLYKLGTFIAKHKWLSIIIWLVVLGVVIAPLLVTSPKFDSDIKMNGF